MANGNTYYLQGRTNLSDLFEQFDVNEDLEPIIECSGNDLVLNEGCDAADPDGKIYNITIKNSGSENKFILEDKSRIRLGATLPTNVCPWVDPDHPLPYCDPVTGNYQTNNTANARCEIQLNGNFGLGGGPANLPTETRPGAFWAKCAGSPTVRQIKFDREFNVYPGDVLVNITSYNNIKKYIVASYDPINYIVTFDSDISNRNVNLAWVLCSGGVLLQRLNLNSNAVYITTNTNAGTLVICTFKEGDITLQCTYNCTISINRFLCFPTNSTGSGCIRTFGNYVTAKINQCGCEKLFHRVNGSFEYYITNAEINEVACYSISYHGTSGGGFSGKVKINGGFIHSASDGYIGYPCDITISNTENGILYIANNQYPNTHCQTRSINCLVNGSLITDTMIMVDGTIQKTLKSGFPKSTDLPDAWYHKPSSSTATTWRYEDHWLRKNETMVINCKFLPLEETTVAKIAITDGINWYPQTHNTGLIEPFAEYVFKNLDSNWYTGQLIYTNNSGEDCQIRLWEIVTGNDTGGFLRTWRSSGGIL